MAKVPNAGNFKMFGTGSLGSIQNALIQGGAAASTVQSALQFSASNQLIDLSTENKYDDVFAGDSITDRNIHISSSEQWRGYPIATSFNFTSKCIYVESSSIPDPTPNPSISASTICVDNYYHNVIGFAHNSVGNITGSSGNDDATYPVSSSYDINSLTFTTTLNRLYLQITTGSDPDDPPTFTSLTLTSSAGEHTLNYCDLYESSSTSTGLFNYAWNSANVSSHFTRGNCITFTFDTTSVDYFTDCFPAIGTTGATRTIGSIPQNKQQSCDALTISNIYFSSSDLDNGITVGDYVYTDSDGRNPFDGQSKYWGINTSSGALLNSVPDKICQIVSNGLITAISDCTPTPAPVLPTASIVYDCDTTSNNNVISLTTASYAGNTYLVYNISGDSEVTQSFGYSGLSDRPNKFTAFDSSGSYNDPIYTTGWVGDATYTNTGGQSQWSSPLSATSSGSIQIKWKSSTGRKIQIDYGRANPDSLESDSAIWCLVCSGSLKNLQIATGSNIIEACRSGSIGDSNHYHYHPTSSFSSARVYNDNDGLDHVTGSSDYFSYTSSDGTRYYYQVGTTGNFGSITTHAVCPGTKIAGIYMGASGEDCDDNIPTLSTNLVYVKSDWSGFVEQTNIASSSYGDLVIDNTNFGANDEVILEIYDNDHDGTNIDPKSRTNISEDVNNTDNATTYLVERTSLLDQSSGANKILATVEKDDARTPTTTIKFSPCDGYGDCTAFETSNGFYASSFSGNDPAAAGMCTNTFTSTLYIEMSGLQPQAGETPSLTCGGSVINDPNTYFTIRNSIVGTFIIKMNSDSSAIEQVWTCTGADAPSTGSNTFWISGGGKSSLSSFCGQGSDENEWDEFTTDAPSWSGGVGYTVYNDLGAAHNGGGKYWRLYQTYANAIEPDSYDAPGVNQAIRYWKINSAGTITSKHTFTCST